MINLISDLTVRDFGGYHAVLAVHAEGSIEAEKMQIFRAYDASRAIGLARRLAGPRVADAPAGRPRPPWYCVRIPWDAFAVPAKAVGRRWARRRR